MFGFKKKVSAKQTGYMVRTDRVEAWCAPGPFGMDRDWVEDILNGHTVSPAPEYTQDAEAIIASLRKSS